MKALFFDTGPVISLVMSRLIWILPKLKQQFGGKFYITPGVKYELVDRPLTVKRFEFEALQVMKLIREGVFEVYEKIPKQQVKELKSLANGAFRIRNKSMDVVQAGELESVASALQTNSAAVVMDERTLRLFIENNKEMKALLQHRFHSKVEVDQGKATKFSQLLKKVTIIRSIELVSLAYKLGLLDDYIPKMRRGKEVLIDSVLWATKTNGCAVTRHEIDEIKNYLLR